MATVLPPSLRRLLRDAQWAEAAVTAPSCSTRDGPADQQQQQQQQHTPAHLGRHHSRSGGAEGEEGRRSSCVLGAGGGGLLERMGRVASRASGLCPPSQPPPPATTPPHPPRKGSPAAAKGAGRGGGGVGEEEVEGSASGGEDWVAAAAAPSAFVKLACHLSEGVAVLVGNGFLHLWAAFLRPAELRALMATAAPAVSLPLQEVLERLAGSLSGAVGHVAVVAGGEQSLAAFTPGHHWAAADDTVTVTFRSLVTVVEGFTAPLEIPIRCARLPSAVSAAGPGLTAERCFQEMVLQPMQARMAALGEALLLLCAESALTPAHAAARATAVFQERYRAAEDALQQQQPERGEGQHGAAAAASASASAWETHRAIARGLLRSLESPPALQPFGQFATDLLRFAAGEANQLVSCPSGTVGGGAPPLEDADPLPPAVDGGQRGGGGAVAAYSSECTRSERATASPQQRRSGPRAEGGEGEEGEGSARVAPHSDQTPPPSPLPPQNAPVPTTTTTAAVTRDEQKKRRQIRRLFS